MHIVLAALSFLLILPVVQERRIRHTLFVRAIQQAHSSLSDRNRIEWCLKPKGRQEKKMLEKLEATAEFDEWTVRKTGRVVIFLPPSTEVAETK